MLTIQIAKNETYELSKDREVKNREHSTTVENTGINCNSPILV